MESETVMTKALEDAFREAQKLPEREQDQLAAAIRAEIDADRAWDAKLAASGGALALRLRMKRWPNTDPAVRSRSIPTSSELQDV